MPGRYVFREKKKRKTRKEAQAIFKHVLNKNKFENVLEFSEKDIDVEKRRVSYLRRTIATTGRQTWIDLLKSLKDAVPNEEWDELFKRWGYFEFRSFVNDRNFLWISSTDEHGPRNLGYIYYLWLNSICQAVKTAKAGQISIELLSDKDESDSLVYVEDEGIRPVAELLVRHSHLFNVEDEMVSMSSKAEGIISLWNSECIEDLSESGSVPCDKSRVQTMLGFVMNVHPQIYRVQPSLSRWRELRVLLMPNQVGMTEKDRFEQGDALMMDVYENYGAEEYVATAVMRLPKEKGYLYKRETDTAENIGRSDGKHIDDVPRSDVWPRKVEEEKESKEWPKYDRQAMSAGKEYTRQTLRTWDLVSIVDEALFDNCEYTGEQLVNATKKSREGTSFTDEEVVELFTLQFHLYDVDQEKDIAKKRSGEERKKYEKVIQFIVSHSKIPTSAYRSVSAKLPEEDVTRKMIDSEEFDEYWLKIGSNFVEEEGVDGKVFLRPKNFFSGGLFHQN